MSNAGTKLKSTPPEQPTLRFTQLAWEKMWAITYGNKVGDKVYECSSMGIMSEHDPCLVEDFIVVKQKNTPSHTEMDDDELGAITMILREQGIAPSRMALWHHTHADFSTFWSTTDTNTIERYAADVLQWAVVTSTKGTGEILVRCDMFKPFRTHFDDCEYEVEYPKLDLKDWTDTVLSKMDNSYSTGPRAGRNTNYSTKFGRMVNGTWIPHADKTTTTTTTTVPVVSSSTKKREAQVNVLRAAQNAVSALDEAYGAHAFTGEECAVLTRRLLSGEIQATSLIAIVTERLDKLIGDKEPDTVLVRTEGAADEATKVIESESHESTEICVSTVEKTSPATTVDPTVLQQAGAIDG